MGMLDGLLGGLVDKELETKKTLNKALAELSKEYNCGLDKIMIMIKGENSQGIEENEDGEQEEDGAYFTCNVYVSENGRPVLKREIKIKEIIDD